MGSKSEQERELHTSMREYCRGQADARSDRPRDDGSDLGVQAITLGFAGHGREGAESYHQGYSDAAKENGKR